MKSTVQRYDVLDCSICRVDLKKATDLLIENVERGCGGYVCFSNVHTVVMARQDIELRRATNNSFMSVPDGRPLMLLAKLRGLSDVGHVPGPSFMPHLFGEYKTIKHYFYGASPDTLARLTAALQQRYPESIIVGHYSPPYRDLTAEEDAAAIAAINACGPDVVWVGLGAPKQERWMAKHWEDLRPATLLGVGAAFDITAGVVRRAPAFMRTLSLEWLYRLCQEPRRLWKRYLVTNCLFIYYLINHALRR